VTKEPTMENICFYHANCVDGFGSALVVNSTGDNWNCIPIQYGQDPLKMLQGKEVDKLYVVDFCFNRETILNFKNICTELVIIDHHKTNVETINSLSEEEIDIVFDLEHSGAVLTWKYLHPDTTIPPLLRYIEDRDLWKWELPYSKEVSAGLATLKKDFGIWNKYLHDCIALANIGKPIVNYQNSLVDDLARRAVIITDSEGRKVAKINSSLFQSELGNHLMQSRDIDYAMIYFDNLEENRRIYSLRSIDTKTDVSVIAKSKGGGGHRNSASYSEILP
jgi:oligoribonuclease NrnB/cAMP/cGMP phosphodiesterase (DHH superfamily)